MSEVKGLERFVAAQEQIYPSALAEIRRGAKYSHWMWYIFPQLAGLGRSAMAQRYAISDGREGRAYLVHPVLGPRYIERVAAMQDLRGSDPVAVFGEVDSAKLRSSLTLFQAVGGSSLFAGTLDRWFGGRRDERTIALLGLGGTAKPRAPD